MDVKEILRETISDLVSEEEISREIKVAINEKLSEYTMEKAIRDVAIECIHEKGDEWMHEMVERVINGNVRLDDGWGNTENVGTFEDYARKSLRKQCFDQWKLERKLREAVDEKLKKIATDIVSKHLREDLADEVIKELANEVATTP